MYILDSRPPSGDEGAAWNAAQWKEDDGETQEMKVYAGPMGVWGWQEQLDLAGEIPPTDLVRYFPDEAAQWVSLRSRRSDVGCLLRIRDLWDTQQGQQLPSWFTALLTWMCQKGHPASQPVTALCGGRPSHQSCTLLGCPPQSSYLGGP